MRFLIVILACLLCLSAFGQSIKNQAWTTNRLINLPQPGQVLTNNDGRAVTLRNTNGSPATALTLYGDSDRINNIFEFRREDNTILGSITADGTFTGNGHGLTNLNFPQVKAEFTTNYTATANDTVLFCSGTNQIVTLPATAGMPQGKIFCVISSSTTGSVVVTNATGSQTILGSLSVGIAATNSITVVRSPGGNYW